MTKKLSPSTILGRMRKRLTPEGSWCQGSAFLDAFGLKTNKINEAVSFCLVGAWMAETGRISHQTRLVVKDYLKAATMLSGGNYSTVEFNDRKDTTQDMVLKVIDDAITMAKHLGE